MGRCRLRPNRGQEGTPPPSDEESRSPERHLQRHQHGSATILFPGEIAPYPLCSWVIVLWLVLVSGMWALAYIRLPEMQHGTGMPRPDHLCTCEWRHEGSPESSGCRDHAAIQMMNMGRDETRDKVVLWSMFTKPCSTHFEASAFDASSSINPCNVVQTALRAIRRTRNVS